MAHGVRDGAVGCDAMLANARAMAEATGLPVTVDLEDGYAPDPEGVRDTFGGPARYVGATVVLRPPFRFDRSLINI